MADASCAICYDSYSRAAFYLEGCNRRHFFDPDCIREWLGRVPSCPICRVPLTPNQLTRIPNSRFSRISWCGNELTKHTEVYKTLWMFTTTIIALSMFDGEYLPRFFKGVVQGFIVTCLSGVGIASSLLHNRKAIRLICSGGAVVLGPFLQSMMLMRHPHALVGGVVGAGIAAGMGWAINKRTRDSEVFAGAIVIAAVFTGIVPCLQQLFADGRVFENSFGLIFVCTGTVTLVAMRILFSLFSETSDYFHYREY